MDNDQNKGKGAQNEQTHDPEVGKDHDKHAEKTEGCEFC
ncbi:MAG: hypothetical protein UY65_C0020G0002 [Parcubacteria group bacterium GW2011_GWA2_51_12]|nr:MAG: hypothetical protein UY65_C0020G0002 [Parcubacteria group bacterium GW2011_GWA2_51_12]